MALTIPVKGPQKLRIGTGTAFALEDLGYTENGFNFSVEQIRRPIFGDLNGGFDGDPIDFQKLGERARMVVDLTQYDEAVAAKLRTGLNAPASPRTAGNVALADVGALLFQGGFSYILRAVGTSRYIEFPQCLVEVFEIGKGTPASKLRVSMTAHRKASDGNVYTEGDNT